MTHKPHHPHLTDLEAARAGELPAEKLAELANCPICGPEIAFLQALSQSFKAETPGVPAWPVARTSPVAAAIRQAAERAAETAVSADPAAEISPLSEDRPAGIISLERVRQMKSEREKAASIRGRREAGFTLVELLVVVAIISVLAGLLLPTLDKTLRTARSLACLNNTKQQGLALGLYIDANNDWLPVLQFHDWGYCAYNWKYSLSPYMDLKVTSGNPNQILPSHSQGVFKCPEWRKVLSTSAYGGGYGWNVQIGSSEDNAYYPRMNVAGLRLLSDTVAIADSIEWASGTWEGAYSCRLEKPSLTSTEWAPKPNATDRHHGGLNVLWLDLHADWQQQNVMLIGKANDAGVNSVDYFYMPKKR